MFDFLAQGNKNTRGRGRRRPSRNGRSSTNRRTRRRGRR